ncbi:MAG: hypothetical protein Kow0063_43310 [Anaerolineae bacterium]
MNSRLKKWMVLLGAIMLVGALSVALLAGTALAQGPGPWAPPGGFGWGHGPGMMGGAGMGGWGYGPGGCAGAGGWGYNFPSGGERLSLDQAAETVESYLASYGGSELALGEVMEFSNGFYAQVVEEETGIGAFELLIDPVTGAIRPEPGPNMMWNTRYGHMGGWRGMMGYGYRPPTGEMTVSPEEAVQAAQAYLDQVGSGLTADDHADPFYGYYTLHTLQDGQVVGMLSVNGYTGQVWYHTWHGDFVGMAEGHE